MDDGRSILAGSIGSFLRSRWRGEAPLGIVFWRDMIVVGTAVNVAATLVAVILLGLGWALAPVLAVHFLPVPYNLFLFIAVWRSSGRAGGWAAQIAPLAAAVWLALTVVV